MRHPEGIHKLALAALIATTILVIVVGSFWVTRLIALHTAPAAVPTLPANSAVLGFPINGDPAPDFSLTDQFGHSVSLSSLRGHEVVLAFIDSQCITLCPLTAQIMYDAKTRLSATDASKVELIAVNANPAATSRAAVLAWSYEHGMLNRWLFLTGPAQQLQSIYQQYKLYVKIGSDGSVVHDPVTYVIDTQGHERLLFETLDSNNKSDLLSQEIGLEIGMKQWLPQP